MGIGYDVAGCEKNGPGLCLVQKAYSILDFRNGSCDAFRAFHSGMFWTGTGMLRIAQARKHLYKQEVKLHEKVFQVPRASSYD